MKLHGILTPAWQTCADALKKGVSFKPPYILKSIWEHASIGLNEKSIHHSPASLQMAMRKMDESTREGFFFEHYIDGREFNISILASQGELKVMPPAEINFEGFGRKPRIVDYKAKWDESSYQYHHTNRIFTFTRKDARLLAKIKALTLRCADVFDIKGYARVDFRIDKHGRPFILEVNANPCLSPDSGFTAACMASGLSYPEIVQHILRA
jgi:D-alanine-D-alanine ligase